LGGLTVHPPTRVAANATPQGTLVFRLRLFDVNAEGAVSIIPVPSIAVVRSSIATIVAVVAPAVSTSVHPPVNSAPVP
jgi:hypothetical protein